MTVQAPVWSSQEMVDLLETMARSADRNTLSFTETANIARSAADVIRYLASELRNAPAQGSPDAAQMWSEAADAKDKRINELEAMLARASLGPAQCAPWQPIATAPKNGHEILVVTQGLVRIGFWDEARGGKWSKWPGREEMLPTLWMPLPAVTSTSGQAIEKTGDGAS